MTKNQKIYLGIGIGIVVFLFLGNYHIVTDVGLVERPYFGFSDVIASSVKCTSLDWDKAETLHPSLCPALKDGGYLKTMSLDEINKALKCIEQCPSGAGFDSCNRECKAQEEKSNEEISKEQCIDSCNKTYKNSYIYDTDYRKCVSSCEDNK